jgi:hypothetical protein
MRSDGMSPALVLANLAALCGQRDLGSESIIRDDPVAAAYYAVHVLKQRWRDAEPTIARDEQAALGYMTAFKPDFQQSGWREAESRLRTDPRTAWLYAEHFLRRRWSEAEDVIFTDELARKRYLTVFPDAAGAAAEFDAATDDLSG